MFVRSFKVLWVPTLCCKKVSDLDVKIEPFVSRKGVSYRKNILPPIVKQTRVYSTKIFTKITKSRALKCLIRSNIMSLLKRSEAQRNELPLQYRVYQLIPKSIGRGGSTVYCVQPFKWNNVVCQMTLLGSMINGKGCHGFLCVTEKEGKRANKRGDRERENLWEAECLRRGR
jgi:hypothetical protein